MSTTCTIRNPLQRDGTSQNQRLVDALKPSYVSIDERELSDLLVYAHDYAHLLRYYTSENHPGGDWAAFLEHDVSSLVALIAVIDHEDYKTSFENLHEALEDAANPADRWVAFAALFPEVLTLAVQIDGWYEDAVEELALHTALQRLIGSTLTDALRTLIGYALRAQEVDTSFETLDTSGFGDAWVLSALQSDPALFPSGTTTDEDEVRWAAERVASVFDTFYEALVFLVAEAPGYLQETLDDYPKHQPHMALFLAFLQLFRLAQNHLNTLTEKHLLFYYREVLGLKYRPETPDVVHIIFELAKNFYEYGIPEGTYLKAGKDDGGVNRFYETEAELIVNEASLHEEHGLKSVFVDKGPLATCERNLFITYDLHEAHGQQYTELATAIRSLSELEIKPLLSFWYVRTSRSAAAVQDALATVIDADDAMLVIDATNNITARMGLSDAVESFLAAQMATPGGNNLFITYDLYAPGQNYDAVIEAIESLGETATRVLESLWYVETSQSAEAVRDVLADVTDEHDVIFVLDATNDTVVWDGLSEEVVSFLTEHMAPAAEEAVSEEEGAGVVLNIYAADVANSPDGEGAEIEEEDGEWETFGGAMMPKAKVGFAIASPLFLLQEGTRKITLTFTFAANSFPDLIRADADAAKCALEHNVSVYASGEKGWQSVTERTVAIDEPSITYCLHLGPEAKAVVPYDAEVMADGFDTEYPVLKFVFESEDGVYPYPYFEDLELETLTIDLDVDGIQSLILENDVGVLNPAKPFLPFGPIPKTGSGFLIGSYEAFKKPVTSLDLNVTWGDLPDENFSLYYEEYDADADNDPPPPILGNGDFMVDFAVLKDGGWTQLGSTSPLFDDRSTGSSPEPPAENRSWTLTESLTRQPELEAFTAFSRSLQQGFLQLDLRRDFLHKEYPKRLAEVASSTDDPKIFPNQPYTPLITEISLDYTASQTIEYTALKADDYEDRVEQLFQIHPFGQVEIFPIADEEAVEEMLIRRKLVPEFRVTVEDEKGTPEEKQAEGTLYIGLNNLDPPQNVSILFQVAEGSADPEADTQVVVWSYLAGNEWVDFDTTEIVADSTNGLLTSGIITFAMPKAMTDDNTILPSGIHWIKASVAEQTEAVSKLIGVMPQAVQAGFDNQGNEPTHLATALPAETIGKLKARQAAIKTVSQPYASFGGRLEEQADAFYTRVSERLRHKQRAITLFDYEHLVLEQFSDIYEAKCITHNNDESEHAPGAVKVIVVPNLRNKNAVDPLRPRVSKNDLEEVAAYLAAHASDFVSLYVENPQYEQVQVEFEVKFQPGKDVGYYLQVLEDDIIKYLSPWLYDESADIDFGGRMHRSWIINYVEERDYVDYVTDFKMYHIVEEAKGPDIEEAVATTSSSVLVSAESHVIVESALVAC